MPFRSRKQQRWAFSTHQPFAKRWAKQTDFAQLPASKDAAPLHGPGGLLATPGMGKKQPKWRTKATSPCTACALRMKDGEFGEGITRIRGNLCNVHGKYGACPGSGGAAASGPKLSNQPKQTAPAVPKAPKGRGGGKKGGGKGRAAAKPKPSAAERQAAQDAKKQEREQEQQAKRDAQDAAKRATRDRILTEAGIDKNTQGALIDARDGNVLTSANGAKLASMGLAEQAADGSYRLTAAGRGTVDAAMRGDAGAVRDTLSKAGDAAAKPEKAPKGGGGGAKKPENPTADEKRQQQAQERAQQASATAAAVGLKPADVANLRAAAEGGALTGDVGGLAQLGFVQGGEATDQGRRALAALERGDVRGYNAAIQDARSGQARQAAQQARQAERQQRRQEVEQRRAATDARVAQNRAEAAARRAESDRRRAEADARREEARKRQAARDESRHKAWGVRVKASSPGDYLVVGDAAKPSTYHLQVKRNGTPDHRLMGAAWAALHGGYRGNTYQGPGKTEALAKLKRLYAAEKMELPSEKSFTVFKDARGAYRWIARTTTAYRDRDGEIISTKALEADAARMTATGLYGPLRYWHVGEPDPFDPAAPWGPGLDIGDCDYSIVIGRTSIESGTFKSTALGRAFAEHAADYELSPGFFHPLDQPDAGGVFGDIRRFERSTVPIKYGRASNLFTGLTVKEHRMDQQTYEQRVKTYLADMREKGVPPEVAAQSLAGMEQADKSAEAQGIAFKSDAAPITNNSDPADHMARALTTDVMPGQRFKSDNGDEYIKSPSELDPTGVYYAVKAAPPPPAAEPPLAVEEQADEVLMEEEPALDEGGEEVIGNLTRDEFKALLIEAWTEASQPMMKALDVAGKMAGYVDEMKSMFGGVAQKEASAAAELTALKEQHAQTLAQVTALAAQIAEIEGRQPSTILPDEVEAALKSAGPQQPAEVGKEKIESTPDRPWAGWGALTFPELYGQGPQS